MAGPPAGMTPPLATVLREGRATGNALRTVLVQLAGTGYIGFRNLDRATKVKRDDDPDPLTDPAIDLLDPLPTSRRRSARLARHTASSSSAAGRAAWLQVAVGVNDASKPIKGQLEEEAVRLGWLTRRPTPVITKWLFVGAGRRCWAGRASSSASRSR